MSSFEKNGQFILEDIEIFGDYIIIIQKDKQKF